MSSRKKPSVLINQSENQKVVRYALIQKSRVALKFPARMEAFLANEENLLEDQQKQPTLEELMSFDNISCIKDIDSTKKYDHTFSLQDQTLLGFSKDMTHESSLGEDYQELREKIHFELERKRDLKLHLNKLQKQNRENYLSRHYQELKALVEENQKYRDLLKESMKNKRSNKQSRNNQQKVLKNVANLPECSQLTPKDSKKYFQLIKRRTIGPNSLAMENNLNYQTQRHSIAETPSIFLKRNNHTGMRQSHKPIAYESTTNLHSGQSCIPSPKRHKRRQSQLTERKDYPNAHCLDDFLLIDNGSCEISFDNGYENEKLIQKQRQMHQQSRKLNFDQNGKQSQLFIKTKAKREHGSGFRDAGSQYAFSEKQSFDSARYREPQYHHQSQNKGIFLDFLQQLLVEEKINEVEMTQEINEEIFFNHQSSGSDHSRDCYVNDLEAKIKSTNRKLENLNLVVRNFQEQIKQIMGSDVKQVVELIENLQEVKGKYLEMQVKVNGLTKLKGEVQNKQQTKQRILSKRAHQKKQSDEPFEMPQSLRLLFQVIGIEGQSKLTIKNCAAQLKLLSQRKELFLDKKRNQSFGQKGNHIRQLIDKIREGRSKFNEILGIYQGRICKLQEKIQRFKEQQSVNQLGSKYKKKN